MLNHSFSLSLFPRIEFGSGSVKLLPEKIALYGQRILLITGAHSFYQSPHWLQLIAQLEQQLTDQYHIFHSVSWQLPGSIGMEDGETDFAIPIQIRVKSCLSIIRHIR